MPLLPAQVDLTDKGRQVDKLFADFQNPRMPGLAVGVVRGDSLVFAKGYGSANLEYDIPITPRTVFHIASISKQFTIFSILLLESQGKLNLDDNIRKYVPEVPDFGQTITLRHLATHTSGLRDQWNLLLLAGWRMDDVITQEHILKLVSRQKELNFTPGEQFNYCNTGYTLLAEVVERVSGQSFPNFARDHIFQPLGMSNTLIYDDHQKIVPNRAYSYYRDQTGYKKSVLSYANFGPTSLFTTVEDLGRWSMNFSNPQIGGEAVIRKMNAPVILNNGQETGAAFGQFYLPYHGLSRYFHGGRDAGYRTHLARFPEQGLSVIVLSNFAGVLAQETAMRVADIFLPESMDLDDEHPVVTLSPEEARGFTGHYWNKEDAYTHRITLRDGRLWYAGIPPMGGFLVPAGRNTFQLASLGLQYRVEFEDAVSARKMRVTGNGVNPVIGFYDGEPETLEYFEPVALRVPDLDDYVGTYFSEELQTTYDLVVEDGGLVLKHLRHSDIHLQPLKEDIFLADQGFFGTLRFKREIDGSITGLMIHTGRVKNLPFEKL